MPGTGVLIAALAVCAITLAWVGSHRIDPERAQPAGRSELRIDLNNAGAEMLELLPGVGPSLAARIVSERRTGGRFRSVADLARVHGIGPLTVARIEPWSVAEPGP